MMVELGIVALLGLVSFGALLGGWAVATALLIMAWRSSRKRLGQVQREGEDQKQVLRQIALVQAVGEREAVKLLVRPKAKPWWIDPLDPADPEELAAVEAAFNPEPVRVVRPGERPSVQPRPGSAIGYELETVHTPVPAESTMHTSALLENILDDDLEATCVNVEDVCHTTWETPDGVVVKEGPPGSHRRPPDERAHPDAPVSSAERTLLALDPPPTPQHSQGDSPLLWDLPEEEDERVDDDDAATVVDGS